MVGVLLGDGDNQAQVGLRELLPRLLGLGLAAQDPLQCALELGGAGLAETPISFSSERRERSCLRASLPASPLAASARHSSLATSHSSEWSRPTVWRSTSRCT